MVEEVVYILENDIPGLMGRGFQIPAWRPRVPVLDAKKFEHGCRGPLFLWFGFGGRSW